MNFFQGLKFKFEIYTIDKNMLILLVTAVN